MASITSSRCGRSSGHTVSLLKAKNKVEQMELTTAQADREILRRQLISDLEHVTERVRAVAKALEDGDDSRVWVKEESLYSGIGQLHISAKKVMRSVNSRRSKNAPPPGPRAWFVHCHSHAYNWSKPLSEKLMLEGWHCEHPGCYRDATHSG